MSVTHEALQILRTLEDVPAGYWPRETGWHKRTLDHLATTGLIDAGDLRTVADWPSGSELIARKEIYRLTDAGRKALASGK